MGNSLRGKHDQMSTNMEQPDGSSLWAANQPPAAKRAATGHGDRVRPGNAFMRHKSREDYQLSGNRGFGMSRVSNFGMSQATFSQASQSKSQVSHYHEKQPKEAGGLSQSQSQNNKKP